MRHFKGKRVSTYVGATLVVMVSTVVQAQPAPDPMATVPGLTRFNFEADPIPADFFGPGSDPFSWVIDFNGVPIDPSTTGEASTLLQRSDIPVDPESPNGTQGTVDVEIVALSLIGPDPITVTFNGGQSPEPWVVSVTLSEVPAGPGSLTATKTHANGGTFDSILLVQPKFTFTSQGTGGDLVLDFGVEGRNPIDFNLTGAPFVFVVNPGLKLITPSNGTFVPGVNEIDPSDVSSQVAEQLSLETDSPLTIHVVMPPSQEDKKIPTVTEWGMVVMTLLVLAAGTIMFARRRAIAATI